MGWRTRSSTRRPAARPASSLRAQGADREGDRYVVQLVLAGTPYHKPKHTVGRDTVGLDVGPASIAIVPREGEARLEPLCAELRPDARAIRRMQRQMDRQGVPPIPSTTTSGVARSGAAQVLPGEQATPRGPRAQAGGSPQESAWPNDLPDRGRGPHHHHREAFLQRLASPLWQERGTPGAPGMLIAHLKRTVASTGGTLTEVPTRATKLSQWCHGCGEFVPKPHAPRWHQCPCGIGPVQRDLYSAFLAAHLDPADPIPSCARYQQYWEGAGVGGEARRAGSTRASQRTRERGWRCPEAWASLVPERVCPKV